MDSAFLQQWTATLDRLTYYQVLGIEKSATFDDIKTAFTAFAEIFHPDAHSGRSVPEVDAISRIFRRGTEAHRVLSEPSLRAQYDDSVTGGETRLRASASMMPSAMNASIAPPSMRLEDRVKNSSARPFARRAEELLKNNDPKQAKIQLVMAMHLEANNQALADFMQQIETRIAARNSIPPK